MYRSGQFLSYNAVHGEAAVSNEQGDVRWFNVIETIYTISEFVEFAHRLAVTGLYRDGYQLDISLRNTRGRRLSAGRGEDALLGRPEQQRRHDPDRTPGGSGRD